MSAVKRPDHEAPTSVELASAVSACRRLIDERFPDGAERGAAAVLTAGGQVLTGTSPDFANPSVDVCHEIEPYCAAFRLDTSIVASVCLHRSATGEFLVLSPCGVCRERLAPYGPDVLVAVPDAADRTGVRWVTLREALPHYWLSAFPDEATDWA